VRGRVRVGSGLGLRLGLGLVRVRVRARVWARVGARVRVTTAVCIHHKERVLERLDRPPLKELSQDLDGVLGVWREAGVARGVVRFHLGFKAEGRIELVGLTAGFRCLCSTGRGLGLRNSRFLLDDTRRSVVGIGLSVRFVHHIRNPAFVLHHRHTVIANRHIIPWRWRAWKHFRPAGFFVHSLPVSVPNDAARALTRRGA
jgi:hypothetical protein